MKIANENENQTKKHGSFKSLDGALLKEMLRCGRNELKRRAEEINKLNVFPVPDGDTGDNMLSTVESGLRAIEGLETNDLSQIMLPLSHGMLLGARGNSGVILSQFFKGVADGLGGTSSADAIALGYALELGVKEAYETVTTPTEGTILTVARESVAYAVSKINPKTTIKSFFADLVKELRASLERTPELLPALKDAGVVDSGGAGLFYLLDGFKRALRSDNGVHTDDNKLDGEGALSFTLTVPKNSETANTADEKGKDKATFSEDSVMQYAYCTELLVQLTRAKCDTDSIDAAFVRRFLISIGDSVAVVKSGSVIKIHVHTMTPDKALSFMLSFGEFISVKIENMSFQHSNIQGEDVKNDSKSKPLFTRASEIKEIDRVSQKSTKKRYGIIAVANGDGIASAFTSLGADEVINVTEKQSPSAHDFLERARRIGAQSVFVFPNNKNFILAAEQAAKMTDDFEIHVIKTKNIAEGYSALSVTDTKCESVSEIKERARDTVSNTASGFVFTAAKDTRCDGVRIKKGDALGYSDNTLMAKSKSVNECALKLIKRLASGKSMLTVYKGRMSESGELEILKKRIKKSCPELEVYTIDSGQDVFNYIFGAE